MEVDLDAALIRYNEFFEHLTDERVEGLRELASPSVRYRDPLMDAQGIDAVVAYLHKVCTDTDALQFETKGYARNGRLAFSQWRMTFRIKKNPKELWEVDGVSKYTFDDAGRVEDHIDYWDASPLLEGLPVIGNVVTLSKRVLTG